MGKRELPIGREICAGIFSKAKWKGNKAGSEVCVCERVLSWRTGWELNKYTSRELEKVSALGVIFKKRFFNADSDGKLEFIYRERIMRERSSSEENVGSRKWDLFLEKRQGIFLKILFIFREREREGERGRETSIGCLSRGPDQGTWPATPACTLSGNQAGELSVCRTAPNPLSHPS